MITLNITEEMHSQAIEAAKNLPIYDLSYRGGGANEIGCLGEAIVESWLKFNKIWYSNETDQTTHDYSLKNGQTFEVKTKDRTVPMKANYECTIPDYNSEHQNPDFYIFVSIQRNKENNSTDIRRFHTAYIVGGVNKEYFKSNSKEWKKGEIDLSNDMTIKFDCHNIAANLLAKPDKVIEKLKHISSM